MNTIRLLSGVCGLVALGTSFSAHAQAEPQAQVAAVAPVNTGAAPSSQATIYAAARDSLLVSVAAIHDQAKARIGYFTSSYGSLGGLHRQVKSYVGTSPGIAYDGSINATLLVKKQSIKRRLGVELEKVVYYDASGRQVLTERYEDHQLTRLELTEYSKIVNTPSLKWLYVRGDYLSRTSIPLLSSTSKKTTSYFFNPLPHPSAIMPY